MVNSVCRSEGNSQDFVWEWRGWPQSVCTKSSRVVKSAYGSLGVGSRVCGED